MLAPPGGLASSLRLRRPAQRSWAATSDARFRKLLARPRGDLSWPGGRPRLANLGKACPGWSAEKQSEKQQPGLLPRQPFRATTVGGTYLPSVVRPDPGPGFGPIGRVRAP
jgi:hypothetical protein